jgi:hypothetical protein
MTRQEKKALLNELREKMFLLSEKIIFAPSKTQEQRDLIHQWQNEYNVLAKKRMEEF